MIVARDCSSYETRSDMGPFEVWQEDCLYVMPEVEDKIRELFPYMNLDIQKNKNPDNPEQEVVVGATDNGKRPPPKPKPIPEPSTDEKIQALIDQNDFLEECIVEMAEIVYS